MKYPVKTDTGYMDDSVLKERSLYYAREQKENGEIVFKDIIVFRLNKRWFGIVTKDIQKIISFVDIIVLPRSKPILIGLVNVDGNFLPVVDISQPLRTDSVNLQNLCQVKVFVVESSEFPFCFLAEEIFGVITKDQKSILSLENFSQNSITNKTIKVLINQSWEQVFLIEMANLQEALTHPF